MRHYLLGVVLVYYSFAAPVSAEPLKIVAFGDSTTAIRGTIEQVYAQRLPNLLKEKGFAAKVINAGVGGSHTGRRKDNGFHGCEHALDRFNKAVRAHEPDIVIVQFGLNDSWVDTGRPINASRIPLEDYRKNLLHIVSTLSDDGIIVILMTSNCIGAEFEQWRYKLTESYAQAARELSESQSKPIVDVWMLFESYGKQRGRSTEDLLLDGVHPNDRGHAIIAAALTDQIATILQDDSAIAVPTTSRTELETTK